MYAEVVGDIDSRDTSSLDKLRGPKLRWSCWLDNNEGVSSRSRLAQLGEEVVEKALKEKIRCIKDDNKATSNGSGKKEPTMEGQESSNGVQFNSKATSDGSGRKKPTKAGQESSTGVQLYNGTTLMGVQVAADKLFYIEGDRPQLMNWEQYGLKITVQKGSLLSSETAEVAVVALVGGQFAFPCNTVLVSGVYAVLLSKPLLKPLQLEIQHCVDLTGQPALSRYLNWALAPVNTPSLPYQFSIVKGGEFTPGSRYGSIQCEEPWKTGSLVCILGQECHE